LQPTIEAARDNLQAAEKLLEETKAELLEGLQSVGEAVPPAAREVVLNEIYWRWPELTTTQIAEAFGYRQSDLRRLIKPYYSEEHPCLACGAPLRITSRSKMVEIERVYKAKGKGGRSYDWHARCERCEAERKEAREAEWQASSQQYVQRQYELRTMPYQEYLQTPEWQARRQRHLRSAGYRCQLCNTGDRSLHVHHRTYERRGDERWADLLVLCSDCHAKHHDRLGVIDEASDRTQFKRAESQEPERESRKRPRYRQFEAEEGFAMARYDDDKALYATFAETQEESQHLYANLDPSRSDRDEVYLCSAVRLTDTNTDYKTNWPKPVLTLEQWWRVKEGEMCLTDRLQHGLAGAGFGLV
jgi:5-methylcytosine-specific restriction endonuclease McrA